MIGCWECAHGPVQIGPIDKEVQSLRRRANAQVKQPQGWLRGSFVRSSASAQRFPKIVELDFGGYAFVQEDVKYQPSALPFRPEHLAGLEKEYKSVIEERKKFDYRDSDWLMAGLDLPPWDEYHQLVEVELESSLTQRGQLNEIYASRLPKEIQLPEKYQTWRFNIRVKNKKQILDAIFANGLFASSHYASLAGIMSDERAPAAESLADEVINLFNDHNFTVEMAEKVCEIVLEATSL